MEEVIPITDCTGCKICSNVCPTKAISMIVNEEGFHYPSIKTEICIDCELCRKNCPVLTHISSKKNKKTSVLAGRNKNKEILMSSSSGGIYHALASAILKENGSVFGVALNSNYMPEYTEATTYKQLKTQMGSKYVEANCSEHILKKIIECSREKKTVLISGIPCFIEGIYNYLHSKRIDMTHILLVDFLKCSGSPSRKLWEQKIVSLQKKDSALAKINFRSKKYGWRNYSFETIGKQQKAIPFQLNDWGKLFLSVPYSCRPSCYQCKFNTSHRIADISLGDLWNSYYIPLKWSDDKGCSIITINTEKGNAFIQKTKIFCDFENLPKESLNWLHFDEKPTSYLKHKNNRNLFYKYLSENGYEKTVKKYCKITLVDILKTKIIKPILVKTHLLKWVDKLTFK